MFTKEKEVNGNGSYVNGYVIIALTADNMLIKGKLKFSLKTFLSLNKSFSKKFFSK